MENHLTALVMWIVTKITKNPLHEKVLKIVTSLFCHTKYFSKEIMVMRGKKRKKTLNTF